jgi:hypothetical protein
MEEKEFNQRLHEIFKEMLSVLKSIRQGFWVENPTFLREAETKLRWILTSNLPFTEELGVNPCVWTDQVRAVRHGF